MRRVAEIMYIVPEQREAFLNSALHPDEECKKMLWACGVRNQQYFGLNGLVFMTFEYAGNRFQEDMQTMAAYLSSHGYLISKRRRDVPPAERDSTNWWAPVKRLGSLFETTPFSGEDEPAWEEQYLALYDGSMYAGNADLSYSEEDWTEDIHF